MKNNFIKIETPSPLLHTLKIGDNDSFRPSATGKDLENTKLKVIMELLEIEASKNVNHTIVSSAAHTDRLLSIKNAALEAEERLSASAWWAFDRPILGKASNEEIEYIYNEYKISRDYEIAIGYIFPTQDTNNYVAVSIIKNMSKYPFIVLGTGASDDKNIAKEKAFVESIQSWTATEWESNNDVKQSTLWDISELLRRFDKISQTNCFPDSNIFVKEITFSSNTIDVNDAFVTLMHSEKIDSTRSSKLAEIAIINSELYATFTDHNH